MVLIDEFEVVDIQNLISTGGEEMIKMLSEEVVGIRTINTTITCKECGSTSIVSNTYLLSEETVERDFLNGVSIGNTFIVCPVCRNKKFFWEPREG